MIRSLREQCELFTRNKDLIKKSFIWELSSLYPLCAMLYAGKGKEVDINEVKRCKEMISNHSGWFSDFTGTTYLILAAKLALEAEPDKKFEEVIRLQHLLKKTFWNSPYLPLMAYTLSCEVKDSDYEAVVLRAKGIHQKMAALGFKEDIGFAALLALSGRKDKEILEEIQSCYEILREKFISTSAVAVLSHALALGSEASEIKCQKVIQLYHKLRERGCKFGTGVELASLGLLALVAPDIDEAVEQILEVNIYLLSSKGVGAFSIGKAQRLMYAALFVAQNDKKDYIQNLLEVPLNTKTVSIMIAEQVALTAAIESISETAEKQRLKGME